MRRYQFLLWEYWRLTKIGLITMLKHEKTSEMDCLIVRQPYASLIAYGLKRIEFRTYNCKKRGPFLIASGRGKPLTTADPYLNSISKSFPRGYILARAVLTNSFIGNNEFIKEQLKGEEPITIHRHSFQVASKPFGEPIKDLIEVANDKNWKMYFWILKNVYPLDKMIPLAVNGTGSSWIRVKAKGINSSPTNLEDYM